MRPAQIDDLVSRARCTAGCSSVAADGRDAIAANGDRLGFGHRLVDGDDLAVTQHHRRRLHRRGAVAAPTTSRSPSPRLPAMPPAATRRHHARPPGPPRVAAVSPGDCRPAAGSLSTRSHDRRRSTMRAIADAIRDRLSRPLPGLDAQLRMAPRPRPGWDPRRRARGTSPRRRPRPDVPARRRAAAGADAARLGLATPHRTGLAARGARRCRRVDRSRRPARGRRRGRAEARRGGRARPAHTAPRAGVASPAAPGRGSGGGAAGVSRRRGRGRAADRGAAGAVAGARRSWRGSNGAANSRRWC